MIWTPLFRNTEMTQSTVVDLVIFFYVFTEFCGYRAGLPKAHLQSDQYGDVCTFGVDQFPARLGPKETSRVCSWRRRRRSVYDSVGGRKR